MRNNPNSWAVKKKLSNGFSVIELMITIVVLAILVAAATPAFLAFVGNSRVEQESQGLYALINKTRQTAISTGRRAYVCRAVDSAANDCKTSNDNDWSGRKIVYSPPSSILSTTPNANYVNQALQTLTSTLSATDRLKTVLATVEPTNASLTVESNRDDNVIVFNGSGQLINQAPMYFSVCDGRDSPEQFGRLISISAAGKIRVESIQDSDGSNKFVDCEGS